MKKRLLALFLVLLMLLPAAASAEVKTALKREMSTRSGPGTKYSEDLYTISAGTKVTVIGQAETYDRLWYHIEFTKGGKLYRCYILSFQHEETGDIPWEEQTYVNDVTLRGTVVYYGPGENYAPRYKRLDGQSDVRVFAVEGEWAFCEFQEYWTWTRGYIHVDNLKNTQAGALPAPTLEPAPIMVVETDTPAPAYVPVQDGPVCEDFYGNWISCAGRSASFPQLAANLPLINEMDGIVCAASMPIFTGPGFFYYQEQTGDAALFQGIQGTVLRVYGHENGWLLMRYTSDIYGGVRYGWTPAAAISQEDLRRVPPMDTDSLPAVLTQAAIATNEPESAQPAGVALEKGTPVTAMAFLDMERQWVLCEYSFFSNGAYAVARGFLPADSLALQ